METTDSNNGIAVHARLLALWFWCTNQLFLKNTHYEEVIMKPVVIMATEMQRIFCKTKSNKYHQPVYNFGEFMFQFNLFIADTYLYAKC